MVFHHVVIVAHRLFNAHETLSLDKENDIVEHYYSDCNGSGNK